MIETSSLLTAFSKAKTSNDTLLHPADYKPVIQALDGGRIIRAENLMNLMTHAATNELDFVLDYKYIAFKLDYQLCIASTVNFFNTKARIEKYPITLDPI